jgi:hypothetical protein
LYGWLGIKVYSMAYRRIVDGLNIKQNIHWKAERTKSKPERAAKEVQEDNGQTPS